MNRAPGSDRRIGVPSVRYAPGESPFRIKGVLYQATIAFFETRVKGGVEALYREIDDPRILAFIQQKFLPSTYYDALPVLPLIRAEARTMGLPVPVYLRQRAEYQAEQDLNGVYKLFLRMTSPEGVLERIPRFATQFLNFGRCEIGGSGVGLRYVMARAMPAMLADWYGSGFTVYFATALRHAGAKTCTVTMLPLVSEGKLHDIDIARITFEARWTT
jgi:hypothetical protein